MPNQSIDELRAQAAEYLEMAQPAMNEVTTNSLLRLAERFETLASMIEQNRANS